MQIEGVWYQKLPDEVQAELEKTYLSGVLISGTFTLALQTYQISPIPNQTNNFVMLDCGTNKQSVLTRQRILQGPFFKIKDHIHFTGI